MGELPTLIPAFLSPRSPPFVRAAGRAGPIVAAPVAFVLWLVADSLGLAAGAAVAGIAAARLRDRDRLAAAAVGAAAWLLLRELPNGGADSPVNWILGCVAAGFAAGALSAWLAGRIGRRPRPI